MIRASTPSIAIVGAGPGGLATAVLLGAAGLRVTVYESAPDIGGRTGRVSVSGALDPSRRYFFDRGPTFFMMPYVLEEILSAAGSKLADLVELRRLDPMYRLLLGSPEGAPVPLDATQNLQEMARRVEHLEAGAGKSFLRFISDNRRKLSLMEPILRNPIRGVTDLMNWRTFKAGTVINPHQSVYAHLGRYFSSDMLRLALSFQSKYLGMSPYECPSLFSILPFIEYEYGIWHPIGGCHALIRALARTAESVGVRILTSTPVKRIEFMGRRAIGVETAGANPGLQAHDHIVINADAGWAIKNLIPEKVRPRELSDESIDAKRYSCSTFMMYLGVEGAVDLPHHTIYISGSYRENIDDISVRGTLSRDPSIYVCNPSRTDPSLAPAGDSSLYVLMPTPNTRSRVNWTAERPRLRAQAFEQLSRALGLENLGSRVRAEALFSPEDWRASNINFGATFSFAHTLGQMLHKRPHHRLQGLDGVWLAGGGTHPGSGLPVIFLSAQITSRLLCEEVGVRAPASGLSPSAARIAAAHHTGIGAGA